MWEMALSNEGKGNDSDQLKRLKLKSECRVDIDLEFMNDSCKEFMKKTRVPSGLRKLLQTMLYVL